MLEASAGTGKTFTIAALAARFIAEGAVTLDQLLLVTFTRIATSELRERVRERLVLTEAQLARVAAGALPDRFDEVVELLAGAPLDTVRERRARLADAIANFDAATIETTHGFCQKVLDGLGTLADTEPSVTFVDDVEDLAREVLDDLYVRRFFQDRGGPALPYEQAAANRRDRDRQPDGRDLSAVAARRHHGGDVPAARRRRARRARKTQARTGVDDLRRPAHAAARHAHGSRR